MERGHTRIHRSLAVLAPPRRFELLMLVLGGMDRSVSQLARAVRLSQSCTTRHLQALERAGLVKGFRDGKRVVFRPAPRDAEAAAVLASLQAEPAQRGSEPRSFTAEPSRRALLEAIPVASTAELEPPSVGTGGDAALHGSDEPGARSAPARARASRRARSGSERTIAPEPATPQDAAESGISAPVPSPGRQWAELEDYLL